MSSGAAVSASPTSESDAQARDIEGAGSPAADALIWLCAAGVGVRTVGGTSFRGFATPAAGRIVVSVDSPTGAVEFAGCLLTGAALHHVGLSPPIIDPEQLILFRIESRPWGRP